MKRVKFKLLFILFLFGMLFSSCRNNKEIPLIRIGEDGMDKIEFLPYTGYTKESANTLNEISLHTINSLNYVESRNHQKIEVPPWELKTFFIGLTLVAGVGIGTLGVEAQGTINLFFDKQTRR
ncbi:MAG: hypothetical protein HQK51_00855 [Oligoflexia bacterium]|nr:hypothetical protein [Oligoflexia bacterium]